MESVPVLVVAVNAGTVDGILLDRPTAEGTLISNPELGNCRAGRGGRV